MNEFINSIIIVSHKPTIITVT